MHLKTMYVIEKTADFVSAVFCIIGKNVFLQYGIIKDDIRQLYADKTNDKSIELSQ